MPPMDHTMLRERIAVARDAIYMNTGWAGPSPSGVLDRVHQALTREAGLGPASPDGIAFHRALLREAREAAARLLRAGVDDVFLTHGTTEGVNIVLHGLDWRPGDELVTCDLEHPALADAAALLAERRGVVVRTASMPPDATPRHAVDAVRQALTPRTRVVALSHVQYSSGLRLPAREIADTTHAAGALVLYDGAQTGGHLALDMAAIGADAYAVSGQKWLLGPTGTGALFMNPRIRSAVRPLLDRAAEGDHAYTLASHGAPLLAGFAEAIRIHEALGPAAVEARALLLGARLKGLLGAIPGARLTGPVDAAASCGLVTIAIDGWPPPAAVDRLWRSHRIAARAVRNPDAVRFSTAPFNTEAECEAVAAAVRELATTAP
ncbi:MAG: aminotransferase class V-fold PLP-dependent enzyme [SAR202 cluster bacterium]|nr:aminotransferase class V-fold PLP-dependent enzyme [SAR202 cluster bacterium]